MSVKPWLVALEPGGSVPHERKPHTSSLSIQLLGAFRVTAGSQAIEDHSWRLRKAQSLLKLLALDAGHRLHREQLMDLLWPDLEPQSAVNNLRRTLHAARTALGGASGSHAGYLVMQHGWLSLCPDLPLWIDSEAFEAAAQAARRSQDPAAYETALRLYSGDLLPQDLYEDWAADRRRLLRDLYLSLLLEQAALHEHHHEYDRAIAVLQQLLTHEPAHEQAHTLLMRLYTGLGQRYQALRQYDQLKEALQRDLGIEPDPASQQLYQAIISGSLPSLQKQPAHETHCPKNQPDATNLPLELTSFIGRECETGSVARLLVDTSPACRLLTLTGPGGCGKTRLALRVGRELLLRYSGGVWLVELAPLQDPALVPQAVASVLGLREEPGRSLQETLASYLHPRHMLLILDNAEHLVEACAALAQSLLQVCAQLQILVTSREALRVAGETLWRVPPLSLPDTQPALDEGVGDSEAIRLFLERARLCQPAFALTCANLPAVIQLCQRLDGLPLAIELAAALMNVLTPDQVVNRLDDRFQLLVGGCRTGLAQHRSLEAVVDWSYQLLSPQERLLFNRLSAFVGGWTLEAAEAVCCCNEIERAAILDLLASLIRKSLVMVTLDEGGAVRYHLLETLRDYGKQQLGAAAEPVLQRHAAYYQSMVQAAEPALRGPEQVCWLERLERDHKNVRAALRWSLRQGEAGQALLMAGGYWRFLQIRGYLSEGQSWLEQALAQSDETMLPARAKGLNALANLLRDQGQLERAAGLHDEALALFRQLDDKVGISRTLMGLGHIAGDQIDYERARRYYEESYAIWLDLGDQWGTALALYNLSAISRDLGKYEQALQLCQQSLAAFHALGDSWGIAIALYNLGRVSSRLGDHHSATAYAKESLALRKKIGIRTGMTGCLEVLAASLIALRRAEEAVRLLGAAETVREALGTTLLPDEQAEHTRLVGAARSGLDERLFSALWLEGQSLSVEQAVDYALRV